MDLSLPVINRIRTFSECWIFALCRMFQRFRRQEGTFYFFFFARSRLICSRRMVNFVTRRSSVAGCFTDVR